jgi:hypothetical protein
MAAALPIMVRLKIAAAAKADFGLDIAHLSRLTTRRDDNLLGSHGVSGPRATKCHRMKSQGASQISRRADIRGLVTKSLTSRSRAGCCYYPVKSCSIWSPGLQPICGTQKTDGMVPRSGSGAEPKSVWRCSKMLAIGFSPLSHPGQRPAKLAAQSNQFP